MDFDLLKSAAQGITMPEETKRRISEHCRTHINNQKKENTMNNTRNTSTFRKTAAVIAVLAVCLTLSVTALAESGVLKGYFADVTNFTGAVIGSTYEQADDEINLSVTVNGDELTVTAAFVDAENPPFIADKLGIAEYRITDSEGNAVMQGTVPSSEIVDGQAEITIDLTGVESGSYRLEITSFVAESKADAPMPVNGIWVCDFTR